MYGMLRMLTMSGHRQTPSVTHFWNHNLELIWMMMWVGMVGMSGMLGTLGMFRNSGMSGQTPQAQADFIDNGNFRKALKFH